MKICKEQDTKSFRIMSASQKGTTLVELLMSLGLIGVIVALGSVLMMNVQKHLQLNTSELGALDESLIFLNRLQKANSLELIDARSPSTQRLFSKKMQDAFEGSGSSGLSLTVSALNGVGERIDIYTLDNKCIKGPKAKFDFYPEFTKDYVQKIFDQYAKTQGATSFAFSKTKCMEFLEDNSSGSSVFFECKEGEVPYAQLQIKNALGQNKGPALKVPANPSGSAGLSAYSPVAAFFCETLPVAGDNSKLIDVAVWSAIIDTYQAKNPDKTKRLKWFLQRMVLSPPSSAGNVQYISR